MIRDKKIAKDLIIRNSAEDGKDYNTEVYNLDAIIAVGYRVIGEKCIVSIERVMYGASDWESEL